MLVFGEKVRVLDIVVSTIRRSLQDHRELAFYNSRSLLDDTHSLIGESCDAIVGDLEASGVWAVMQVVSS